MTRAFGFIFLLVTMPILCLGFVRSSLIANHRGLLHKMRLMSQVAHVENAKKYIVVTGGVISGIGKGVTASSIGVLMKMLNVRPTAIKIDPYLNVDAGTMSPIEHGEVYVLDDGSETDLDLGNYERFMDVRLTNDSNLTTGKVYQSVIAKERRGDYLGKTVQVVPHLTNEIMDRITSVATRPVDGSEKEPDVCVIELGGTIGDIESMPFVEAIRQLQLKVKRENFCLVHVSMVPTVGDNGEQKTKPTQHSVKELRALGLSPDFIVCRSKLPVDLPSREKLSMFCNLPVENVLSIHDVANTYHVPSLMLQQKMHTLLYDRLKLASVAASASTAASAAAAAGVASVESDVTPEGIATSGLNLRLVRDWQSLAQRMDAAQSEAVIALVGKYLSQSDAYLSVTNALRHSCIATNQRLKLVCIDSSHLEEEYAAMHPELYAQAWKQLRGADGLVVPGGFGSRGFEGKLQAIQFARETKLPFLGICLGMQAMVVEYARNVLKRSAATSREFDSLCSDDNAAIIYMPEIDPTTMGGTMRLGSRHTDLYPTSKAYQLYGQSERISERHRHRYEVNPALVPALEMQGLVFSGKDSETQTRMEVVELPDSEHPYFLGTQYHPEFLSRPLKPSPVFLGLLQAVLKRNEQQQQKMKQ